MQKGTPHKSADYLAALTEASTHYYAYANFLFAVQLQGTFPLVQESFQKSVWYLHAAISNHYWLATETFLKIFQSDILQLWLDELPLDISQSEKLPLQNCLDWLLWLFQNTENIIEAEHYQTIIFDRVCALVEKYKMGLQKRLNDCMYQKFPHCTVEGTLAKYFLDRGFPLLSIHYAKCAITKNDPLGWYILFFLTLQYTGFQNQQLLDKLYCTPYQGSHYQWVLALFAELNEASTTTAIEKHLLAEEQGHPFASASLAKLAPSQDKQRRQLRFRNLTHISFFTETESSFSAVPPQIASPARLAPRSPK